MRKLTDIVVNYINNSVIFNHPVLHKLADKVESINFKPENFSKFDSEVMSVKQSEIIYIDQSKVDGNNKLMQESDSGWFLLLPLLIILLVCL